MKNATYQALIAAKQALAVQGWADFNHTVPRTIFPKEYTIRADGYAVVARHATRAGGYWSPTIVYDIYFGSEQLTTVRTWAGIERALKKHQKA